MAVDVAHPAAAPVDERFYLTTGFGTDNECEAFDAFSGCVHFFSGYSDILWKGRLSFAEKGRGVDRERSVAGRGQSDSERIGIRD